MRYILLDASWFDDPLFPLLETNANFVNKIEAMVKGLLKKKLSKGKQCVCCGCFVFGVIEEMVWNKKCKC